MKNRDQNKQIKKNNLEGNRLYRENETSTITTKIVNTTQRDYKR